MRNDIDDFLAVFSRALASKVAIFVLLAIGVYILGFGALGLIWKSLEPSLNIQLLLGNYTNVTSALGATIAAGASVATYHHVKKHLKTSVQAPSKQKRAAK